MKKSVNRAIDAKKHTKATIPSFALYGESRAQAAELLHIEEVQSRSRLYHWEIEPHVHQGLYQILWVQQGRAEIRLDAWRESLTGPMAIVVPPGVVHGFRFEPETDGLVLTLSPRFLVEGEFQTIGQAFQKLFVAPGVLAFEANEPQALRLHALLRELASEFAMPGPADSPVSGWLARSVVWRLAQASTRLQQASIGKRGRHQSMFTRFLVLVEQHFLDHWSLEQYAAKLGLSVQRLTRLVRAESQRSPLDLIHDRLTREACRRLLYIAAPASQLAGELGFDDPAYFSRFFKRRTGMSPQVFRENNRGQN